MSSELYPDEREPALRRKLESIWAWLLEYCADENDHPRCAEGEQAFIAANDEYEALYEAPRRKRSPLPEPSPYVQRVLDGKEPLWPVPPGDPTPTP